MTDSRSTSTRRQALKYAGVTGLSGVAGLTGLSLTSQPALALSDPVTLPSGLTAGSVTVPSYEIQYAELDTTSDITINYVLRTDAGTKTTESHVVSITESTGVVMTGDHTISVPAGEVSLEVQLEHSSVGTVSTNESAPTTVESAIPDSEILYLVNEGSGSSLNDERAFVDATLSGSTWFSDSSSLEGFYLTQDTTDDQITTNSVGFFEGLNEFAISWWARVPSDAEGWWFQRFGGSVPDTTTVTDFVYLNGNRDWQFRVSGDDVLNVTNSTDIDSWFDGVWRQFGVSYRDGDFARFYVDGDRVAENAGASAGNTSTGEDAFHIVTHRDGGSAGSAVDFDGHWLFSQTGEPDSWFEDAYNAHPRT